MIENTDRENSDGKKSNSEKMLICSVTPKSSTATIVSLTERNKKTDNEKSGSKNLFSKMSGRKTLQNENLTTKIPVMNISKKKSTAKSLKARN